MEISGQSPNQADAAAIPDGTIAEAELRLIRILHYRGRLVARASENATSIQRLVKAGLVRAVERPGAEVILVLSGDGLRLAQSAH